MKATYENPYESSKIQELHKIIDQSDLFLLEVLANKSDEELLLSLEKAEKNYQISVKGSNRVSIENAEATVKTICAVIELRRVANEMKRDLSGEDSSGGYSIS